MQIDEIRHFLATRIFSVAFPEAGGVHIGQPPEISLLNDPRICVEQIVFEIASFKTHSVNVSYIDLAGMTIGGKLPDPAHADPKDYLAAAEKFARDFPVALFSHYSAVEEEAMTMLMAGYGKLEPVEKVDTSYPIFLYTLLIRIQDEFVMEKYMRIAECHRDLVVAGF